jgi:hypothetical protein
MLCLVTTDAFAAWFSALDDGAAEDVAATLEVIAQLGTRTEAPGSSEWLLWYEHPLVLSRSIVLSSHPQLSPEVMKALHDWGTFVGYVKRVIKHLESPQFVARVGHLEPRNAAAVADALARIRKVSKSRQLGLGEWQRKRLSGQQKHAPALERFLDLTEVREAYFAALAAVGFDVVDVPAHSPALREISLRARAPGLRLLYGVETRHNRGLVVLGEWLDRSFYGDSVRRAEEVWRRFLDGRLRATQPAGSR